MTTHHIVVHRGVYLSEVRAADKSALVAQLNDRGIYNNTLRIPYPYAGEHAEAFIEFASRATARNGRPVHWAIRGDTDALIGCCGFENLCDGHRAEVGYWLARPYWGRGIMTEVVRTARDFATAEWGLVRIAAHVFRHNAASARVLEKNGFELEGLLRKHHLKDGQFIDSHLYSWVKQDAP